ncbi:hypothetical protein BN844_4748 [Pseudomonas sp. SHC52]|nr:hypothetical protein BN844_4748 [Pseudomonas sp. SHC52]
MIFDELNRLRHMSSGWLRAGNGMPVDVSDAGANTLPWQPASQGSKLHASAPAWVFCTKSTPLEGLNYGLSDNYAL